MNKKELIAKLLDKLSEDDLVELLGGNNEPQPQEEEKTFNTHIHSTREGSPNKRRKGRGNSKSKAQAQEDSGRRSGKRKSKRKGKSRGSRGKSCRVLPMDIDRPRENKFEEMIGNAGLDANERVELSNASAEDEKARSQRTSFKKPKRQSSLVDVDC